MEQPQSAGFGYQEQKEPPVIDQEIYTYFVNKNNTVRTQKMQAMEEAYKYLKDKDLKERFSDIIRDISRYEQDNEFNAAADKVINALTPLEESTLPNPINLWKFYLWYKEFLDSNEPMFIPALVSQHQFSLEDMNTFLQAQLNITEDFKAKLENLLKREQKTIADFKAEAQAQVAVLAQDSQKKPAGIGILYLIYLLILSALIVAQYDRETSKKLRRTVKKRLYLGAVSALSFSTANIMLLAISRFRGVLISKDLLRALRVVTLVWIVVLGAWVMNDVGLGSVSDAQSLQAFGAMGLLFLGGLGYEGYRLYHDKLKRITPSN